MTPEQQRIAIAEACGWTPGINRTWGEGQTYGVPPGGQDWHWSETPNYPSDLNAMHEAEKVLTLAQRNAYGYTLAKPLLGLEPQAEFVTAFTTAAQRAEAFLRTLNLWAN